MKHRMVYLGMDAGGSKGRVALAFEDRILARGLATGFNPRDVGYAAFAQRVRLLAGPLLDPVPRPISSISACAAIAGAGKPLVRRECTRIIGSVLRPLTRRLKLTVLSDADALARAFLSHQAGVVIVAGTGSICVGMRHGRAGRLTASVGGLGGFLDRGSGFWLGLRVLDLALQARDGRRDLGLMARILCEYAGVNLGDLATEFLPITKQEVTPLATVALEACSLGDPSARALVREAARDLVDMVLAVRRRLGLSPAFTVYTSGGLFQSSVLPGLFRRQVGRSLPQATVVAIADPLPHILELARRQVP